MLQDDIDEINKQIGLMNFSKPSKSVWYHFLLFFAVFTAVAIVLKLSTKQTKVMIAVYSLLLATLVTMLYIFNQ